MPKFITRLNKPHVNKLIGKANIFMIGLIKMLTSVNIAAINIANSKPSTLIPGR